jgi:4'-phosphopantetheinyl transferase
MDKYICELQHGADGVWARTPEPPSLHEGEVHVWRAELDHRGRQEQALLSVLSEDERGRAARFHFARDRRRFIAARAALRQILARYLDADPRELRFSYNPFGKPSLAGGTASSTLRFNASHSGRLALFGVTHGAEVGVDVERIREDFEVEELAGRFFSRREVTALLSVPAELRRAAFFNCWTRKEAYIKARGQGLSLPLDQFEVSLLPWELAALLSTAHDPGAACAWDMQSLYPSPGYAGAVVSEGIHWRVRRWQWSFEF